MSTIFTEEGLATRARPLNSRKQETIAAAECKELLLGTGAKTLLADNLAAVSLDQGRGYNFRRARRAGVDHCDDRSGKQIRFGIGGIRLERFSFATDGLCNDTVFNEEVARDTASRS